MKKWLLRTALACLLAYALYLGAMWRLQDGFALRHMTGASSFSPDWEVVNLPSKQLEPILSQTFTYIGKGSQSYVFESEDHRYILKTFRLNRLRLPKYLTCIQDPPFLTKLIDQKSDVKKNKQKALFASCKLAFEQLREESGLIYLHLNPGVELNCTLTLLDPLKRPITLSADSLSFLIQKKAEPTLFYLDRLIKQGKKEEAKASIDAIIALINKRQAKGIKDLDLAPKKNMGFLDGEPLFLDVGCFSQGESKENMDHTRQKLEAWLQART